MGGTCLVNICAGGETLIPPELSSIVRSILEDGHFVMLVTNGTLTERMREYCNFPSEMRARLFFKISFHYLELLRLNKLEAFFENIHMIQDAGLSFTVEITPDDIYIPYIPEIKRVCIEHLGVLPHVTVPRDVRIEGKPLMTKLPREEFRKIWSQFDSELFNFKYRIFEVKRREFCYAGLWGFVLELGSGNYKQCYCGRHLGNLYHDTDKPLNLSPIGTHCLEGHCYNGHAFLGLGLIPELDAPFYAEQRNRILPDGREWLSSDVKAIMSCKLKDANHEYTSYQKFFSGIYANIYDSLRFIKRAILWLPRRIKRLIKT